MGYLWKDTEKIQGRGIRELRDQNNEITTLYSLEPFQICSWYLYYLFF